MKKHGLEAKPLDYIETIAISAEDDATCEALESQDTESDKTQSGLLRRVATVIACLFVRENNPTVDPVYYDKPVPGTVPFKQIKFSADGRKALLASVDWIDDEHSRECYISKASIMLRLASVQSYFDALYAHRNYQRGSGRPKKGSTCIRVPKGLMNARRVIEHVISTGIDIKVFTTITEAEDYLATVGKAVKPPMTLGQQLDEWSKDHDGESVVDLLHSVVSYAMAHPEQVVGIHAACIPTAPEHGNVHELVA